MAQRELIGALNARFPVSIREIEHLREGGSASYVAIDGAGRYLLKLIPAAFRETAVRSAGVLAHLEATGFPAPRLLRARDGAPFSEIDGRLAMLYAFIEGREPDRGERLADVGELVGRLHAAMADYKGRLLPRGKAFFVDRYRDQLRRKGYPERRLERFRELGDALWARADALPRGFCHGDLHRGNLLIAPDGAIWLIDFDTACEAFAMYDVAVMCDDTDYFAFRSEGRADALRALDAFLNGYLRRRALSDCEVAAFCDLIALRHFQLQATILEIYGLHCVDASFVDRQLDWIEHWLAQAGGSI